SRKVKNTWLSGMSPAAADCASAVSGAAVLPPVEGPDEGLVAGFGAVAAEVCAGCVGCVAGAEPEPLDPPEPQPASSTAAAASGAAARNASGPFTSPSSAPRPDASLNEQWIEPGRIGEARSAPPGDNPPVPGDPLREEEIESRWEAAP